MHYRVDNVPWYFRPFFLTFSWLLGALSYGVCVFLHLTCRIRYEGEEPLQGLSNYILCLWHDNLFPYFVVFVRHEKPHIWMNHPAWFMKPIHVLIKLVGVRGLVLGSTGHGGQEAVDELVRYLKQGYSTLITPDGPHGPPKVLKKGVLYMAQKSSIPIVPLKIRTPHCLTLPTWDHKRCPLPFSTIQVIYGEPIFDAESQMLEIKKRL